jgi:DNA-directed RNA polymerase subunit beta'
LILEQGSKEQIRQLTGMRGLMAKPKNQLLVVVKLLKIQFFLTLKKVFLFLSTLFLLTVLVKVLRIRP